MIAYLKILHVRNVDYEMTKVIPALQRNLFVLSFCVMCIVLFFGCLIKRQNMRDRTKSFYQKSKSPRAIQVIFDCQENTDQNDKILGCLIEFLRD